MAGNLDFRLNLLANTTGLQQGMNGAKFAVNALVTAMAAVGIGASVSGLVAATDSYTNLSARINIATKDGGNFTSAMAGVHQVALMTNSSLEATGNLFTKINDAGRQMGMTQQQALDLTKTINQAIQIGGGSAQASEAAIQQFIQALQSGVLRGDEFNSIMEQAPGLTSAMAKGLGVTTGELRKMAEAGELSAERVIKAVQSQASEVQKTYDQFPVTIGNALKRITTSWEILIGKMDQSNGASSTVAQWLVALADNIAELDVVLNDIGEGFVWVGDQLKKVDPATIEALKTALESAYATLKTIASTLGETFEVTMGVLNTSLGFLFDWKSGVDTAQDNTNGFTKALQQLDVVLGTINDGFTGLTVLMNLLAGAAYSAAGAFAYWSSKISFGPAREKAFAEFQKLTKISDDYYLRADNLAMGFESNRKKAIEDISKTQDQKNNETLESSKAKYDELSRQDDEFLLKSKALADERSILEEQLNQARIGGNQAVVAELMAKSQELEAREKEAFTNRTKLKEEELKTVQAYAEAAIKANGGVMDGVMQADLMTKGYIVTLSEAGKVSVEAWAKAEVAIEGAAASADKARKAATSLGLDLDIALSRVSAKFKESEAQVNAFSNNLSALGVEGSQAANILYQAWAKWLETAKSQTEIDFAKAKLKEFGEQGKLSTSQVEMGMQAIRQVVQKLPADIDPVTAAFERLGIKTKEQLALAAQSALADFNTIQSSGRATAESLKQAYERTMQAAAASGNQAVIASTQAKAASLGLQVQVDQTGKATVTSMNEVANVNERVRSSAERIGDGYRSAGQIAREEAQSVKSEWEEALDAAKEDFKNRGNSRQGSKVDSMTKADIEQELRNMGYDEKSAQKRAASIYSQAIEVDKNIMQKNLGQPGSYYTNKAFEDLHKQGMTSNMGTQKVRELLATSSVATISAPAIPKVPSSSNEPPKTVEYKFMSGGKEVSMYGSPNDGNAMEEMLREFEMLKRGT